MKNVFIFFFCLLQLNLFAQSNNYFNRLYVSNFQSHTGAGVILPLNNNYIYLGGAYSPVLWEMSINSINSRGDTLWSKISGTPPQSTSLAKIIRYKKTNEFIVLGKLIDSASTTTTFFTQPDLFLSKYNAQGDSVWFRRFGGSGQDVPADLKQCPDGGFIIAGTTDSYGNVNGNGDFYLIKADSLGNKLWQRTYGGWGVDAVGSVALTSDKGYIIVGVSNSYSSNFDLFVVKTDSLGNNQWQQHYGSVTEDEVGGGILLLQDGNYLITSGTKISGSTYSAMLIKLNLQGGVIWQKYYPDYSTFFQTPAIENSDSTLIIAGGININSTNQNYGWLIKTTSTADTLWTRKYFTRPDLPQYFYDIKPTTDSGYVMCGSAFDDTSNVQRAWVVKVDCMGADSIHYYFPNEACTTTGYGTAVKEIKTNEGEVNVYPNPTANNLKISQFGNLEIEKVRIYNVLGVLMYQSSVISHQSIITIDVEAWRSGIYFIQIETKDKRRNKKFIKE